jgi:hypothetical protein
MKWLQYLSCWINTETIKKGPEVPFLLFSKAGYFPGVVIGALTLVFALDRADVLSEATYSRLFSFAIAFDARVVSLTSTCAGLVLGEDV